MALRENKQGTWQDVFTLINTVRAKLTERGFTQTAKLCSSHNLAKDPVFIPQN
jgi:hypothetical protein